MTSPERSTDLVLTRELPTLPQVVHLALSAADLPELTERFQQASDQSKLFLVLDKAEPGS